MQRAYNVGHSDYPANIVMAISKVVQTVRDMTSQINSLPCPMSLSKDRESYSWDMSFNVGFTKAYRVPVGCSHCHWQSCWRCQEQSDDLTEHKKALEEGQTSEGDQTVQSQIWGGLCIGQGLWPWQVTLQKQAGIFCLHAECFLRVSAVSDSLCLVQSDSSCFAQSSAQNL